MYCTESCICSSVSVFSLLQSPQNEFLQTTNRTSYGFPPAIAYSRRHVWTVADVAGSIYCSVLRIYFCYFCTVAVMHKHAVYNWEQLVNISKTQIITRTKTPNPRGVEEEAFVDAGGSSDRVFHRLRCPQPDRNLKMSSKSS